MSLSSWVHKFSICLRNICTYIWTLLTLKSTPTYQCDFCHLSIYTSIFFKTSLIKHRFSFDCLQIIYIVFHTGKGKTLLDLRLQVINLFRYFPIRLKTFCFCFFVVGMLGPFCKDKQYSL